MKGVIMLEIQKNTLVKAIKLLNSIGVEYAILAGEEKHGTLEVVDKNIKKHGERNFSHKYGRGTLVTYVKPYIENLKVGEVAVIPIGDYEIDAIAATSATYAHKIFGTGGHTGRKDKENNVYEIMRLEV
jgi:hypothetical protein